VETPWPTTLKVSKDDYYKASEIMEYFKAGRWKTEQKWDNRLDKCGRAYIITFNQLGDLLDK
jgi:hypothetical protein